ncbi:hypothetical protein UFOVP1537_39 [uncultured Caudovirales phage]|uniref:Uncharacterized protein n=2 Tax=root TaxID=1 RepID=A0A6J5PHK3_9CAUD|nr:hypothetical protein UFOVP825_4 [uncultured Caudovirales phage]CAB4171299.1 hypothetical protein UFOVP915_39 [uncultured Caudovirales phage]CAB4177186.1 hypothetical protein UFOVP1000_3 [uncultured Caudovirales phage]CAB4183015.1 hypothetical protein UFOVP1092_31 [uncultured Caudovirales phage]CAB4187606.1 hypothetical protein UFOVP1152_35 [uncultured Caudovirales phage]
MGATTETVKGSGMPNDVAGLRQQTIQGLMSGQQAPNMQPMYSGGSFQPSALSRAQASMFAGSRAAGQAQNPGGMQQFSGQPQNSNGLDQRAIAANPAGYQSWLSAGRAAGQLDANGNYSPSGGSRTLNMSNGLSIDANPFQGLLPSTANPNTNSGQGNLNSSFFGPWKGMGYTQNSDGTWNPPGSSQGFNQQNNLQYADSQGNPVYPTNNIFEQLINGPGQSTIAGLPTYDVANVNDIGNMGNATQNQAGQMGIATVDPRGTQYQSQNMGQYGNMTAAQIGEDPRMAAAFAQLMQNNGQFSAPQIDSVTGMSHSIDQIANPNSAFFQNIQGTYNKQADQNQALALAQAKEQSGNLVGSSYANAMGNTVNRSIADRNAQFSNLITNLAGQESGRQTQMAGLEANRNNASAQLAMQAILSGRKDLMDIATTLNQRNTAQAGFNQQANLTNTSNSFNAAQNNAQWANNAASQNASTTNQQRLANAGYEQQSNQGSYNAQQDVNKNNAAFLQQAIAAAYNQRGAAALQDANATNTANTNYFNAGATRNNNQANLDQARWLAQYNGALGQSGNNANRWSQLLGQFGNTGVGPDQVVSKDGAGAMLGELMKSLPAILAMFA